MRAEWRESREGLGVVGSSGSAEKLSSWPSELGLGGELGNCVSGGVVSSPLVAVTRLLRRSESMDGGIWVEVQELLEPGWESSERD